MGKSIKIAGITKIRNEELIIEDTLSHFGRFCDWIYVYDDASTDGTMEICRSHPKVKAVIENREWDGDRLRAEFKSRQAILSLAQVDNPEWLIYFDADERIEFDFEDFEDYDAVKMKLFDFYITEEDKDLIYMPGDDLAKLRKYCGPEYRKIVMFFRNTPFLRYYLPDQREVFHIGKTLHSGYVRHYGKSISIEQWERTCDYYIQHFPKYAEKWKKRKGKAIHNLSDFGRELITWDEKDEKGVPLSHSPQTVCHFTSSQESLNILIGLNGFQNYTGSETYTYYLAKELIRRGHKVDIYSHYGYGLPLADGNLRVRYWNAENIKANKGKYNILCLMHPEPTKNALKSFPHIPAVSVIHGTIKGEKPLLSDQIKKYVCVSQEVATFVRNEFNISEDRVTVVPNFIDLADYKYNPSILPGLNFLWAGLICERTIRSLEAAINITARIKGAQLVVIGRQAMDINFPNLPSIRYEGVRKITSEFLSGFNLVFAVGRTALESIATGVPVYVLGQDGSDGLVTEDNFQKFALTNFSGRTLPNPYSVRMYDIYATNIAYIMNSSKIYRRLCDSYEEIIRQFDSRKIVGEIEQVLKSFSTCWK